MFIVFDEDEILDCELPRLSDLLGVIDDRILQIEKSIIQSSDPDSEGLLDRAEYFIGIGFVATQQHLVDTLIYTGVQKRKAYKLGPIHKSGNSYVNLINASANWWKHEAEWFSKEELPNNAINTYELVTGVSGQHEYALSKVLSSINESENLALKAMVPYIKEWTEAVFMESKKMHNKNN